MMRDDALPLIILGGRDHQTTTLPEGGRDKHLLRGYKAVDVEIGGRPLIEVLIARMRAPGVFDPIYVAGPETVYRGVVPEARIIDTDGTFADNLRACVAAMKAHHPGRQVMFTTCDILPVAAELELVLADYFGHLPCDFWMPQSRVPADLRRLGQSAWKPKYRIQPEGESEPALILPGHLIAVDPQTARLELIFRFFGVLYRTRNQSIPRRLVGVTRAVMAHLVGQDLRRIAAGRAPVVTATVVVNALLAARALARGTATQQALEERLRRAFIEDDHRRRHPERRGRVAVLDALSLARDIDTEEEAAELGRKPPAGAPSP